MKKNELVVILDFGAQYNQLIARRVRELKVESRLIPSHTPPEEIMAMNPGALILSGGPSSVYSPNALRVDSRIFSWDVPILGICYGMQLMAKQLGGNVVRAERREYGRAYLEILRPSPLLPAIKGDMEVWMSHGDHVRSLPAGFQTIARTENTAVAAMADEERKLYGVQFHPEVAHTPRGMDVLKNFLFTIANFKGEWTETRLIEDKVKSIQQQVGDGVAVCGLSGGVDSSVAARLVHEAIGQNLHCIFVDHGLLRQDEVEDVQKAFQEEFKVHLQVVDARQRFLEKLKGIKDPEEKRKIIGHEFIHVFQEEARKIPQADFLVQGTLYSDVIESGVGGAATIKSHHNVGGLPEKMDLKLVEPVRDLFKDEVRRLGEALGLPKNLVWRQPFPGPGLAVRIIGEVNEEHLSLVRRADAILAEELRSAGLEEDIWQAFAVLPSELRSVGVMGDERTYGHCVVLRAVISDDAMTAQWAHLPHEVLDRISTRITNEIEGITRVLYDITSKPPATIEWE